MHPLSSVFLVLLLPLHSSAGCTDAVGCWPPLGNLAVGRSISATADGVPYCSESGQPSDCLNDGKSSTQWQYKPPESTNGAQRLVYLTLSFRQHVVLENMSVWWPQFISPRAFILERSVDFGHKWTAYRYYATNCRNIFGKSATPPFSSPSNTVDAICVEEPWSMIEQNRADFLVSSQFSFSSTDMETIAAYRNITNLRLTLVEPTILSDYELTEWKVIGSCMCNGHSSLCTPMFGESIAEDKVYSGCLCEHNTAGDHCERCAAGYNSLPWRPGNQTTANICQCLSYLLERWILG